jgi:predicted nuclease of predicted toxin-antitoxin system
MLVALGVDAIALRKRFRENAEDVAWIPEVAQNGWILITSDSEMNRRRAEKEALRQNSAIAFF